MFTGGDPSTNRRIHILPGAGKNSTAFPKLPAEEASKPARGRRTAPEKTQNRSHPPDHNPRIRRRGPGLDVAGAHRHRPSLVSEPHGLARGNEAPTGQRTATAGGPGEPAETAGGPDVPAAAGATVPSGRDRGTRPAAGERRQFAAGRPHADDSVFAARVPKPQPRTRGRTATALGAGGGDKGRAEGRGRAAALAERGGNARPPLRLEHVAPEPGDHRRGDPTPGGRPHVRRRAADAGGAAGADDADDGTRGQGGSESPESLRKIPGVDGAAVATQRGGGETGLVIPHYTLRQFELG